ncbi:uncharacterized protein LOC124690372 [Lolium rigidum]|uniref:uncharacterized protein LOC124690372 n=1 Tax=Lolium rigidum TaxID=89674 RepID=UPI001F5D1A3C|nr:uncharacterized protein LOC124690372 [Lolium rigidum]
MDMITTTTIGVLVAELIPMIRNHLQRCVASDRKTIIPDMVKSVSQSRFWFNVVEALRDQHSIERLTEEMLLQLASQHISDEEAYWIVWTLFNQSIMHMTVMRAMFIDKFLLRKTFPLCCLRWILHYAVFEFPPNSAMETQIQKTSNFIVTLQTFVSIWSKKEFVQSYSVEQQAYITAAIGLCLENMSKRELEMTKDVLNCILQGVTCRLESPIDLVRKMASAVALTFSKIVDPKNPLYLDDDCSENVDWEFGVLSPKRIKAPSHDVELGSKSKPCSRDENRRNAGEKKAKAIRHDISDNRVKIVEIKSLDSDEMSDGGADVGMVGGIGRKWGSMGSMMAGGVDNQRFIADGLADVSEGVGEVLELGAVVADGEIALWRVAEVGLELDGAVLLVVAEEILDGVPDGERSGAGMHDDAEEVGVDGAVDPGEHGVVITAPSRGGRRVGGSGFAGDVGGETVAAESNEEELPPACVVAVGEAEGDRHVELDGGGRASPDELRHNAGDLVQALVHVRCSDAAMEGEEDSAEEKRQKALVALLVTNPFESLDVLTKLLYSSSVDISQRILVIDVMTEAAQELAETKIINKQQRHGNLISDTSPSWLVPSDRGPLGASPWREVSEPGSLLSWSHRYEREVPSRSGQVKSGKSRKWGLRKAKDLQVEGSKNKFPLYAAAFMLPVMQGYDKRRHGVDLLNRDFVVLGKLIYMLGVCMKCMAMHPEASALAPALLDMIGSREISQHAEAYVRRSVLFAASCILIALHPSYVASILIEGNRDISTGLEWIRTWALQIAEVDPDTECTSLSTPTILQNESVLCLFYAICISHDRIIST